MRISYADFEKVDFRSGTVTQIEPFPRAKKSAYKV
jgi:tRNA-binding protein